MFKSADLLRLRRSAVPWIVLIVALLASVLAAIDLHQSLYAAEEQRFRREVEHITADIRTRLETYIAILRAGAALFSHNENLTGDEFASFAASLDIQGHYPGIQGIGFTIAMTPGEVPAVVQRMRSKGFDDFQVWPQTVRDEYHAILYLEPLDRRNRAAIGYDMFTESHRREAMIRARDSGEPAASGHVTLVQEIDELKQAGFLIYVPAYSGNLPPETIEERRHRLEGFVYAPFRVDDLLRGIFLGQGRQPVAFRVYDGTQVDEAHRLHSRIDDQAADAARHRTLQQFTAAGRPWTITYFSTPEFDNEHSHRYVYVVLAGGGLISFVLFALTRGQTTARFRAEKTAADLRKSESALRHSEGRFRRLSDSNLVGVAFSRSDGTILDANEACSRILGCTREQIRSGEVHWDKLTPPEHLSLDRKAIAEVRLRGVSTPYEKEFIQVDGGRVPVLTGLAAIADDPDELVAVVIDLTEQKKAEQALVDARQAAEQANRLKDDFLATVSHELRTPLNAILGWTQLLRDDRATPDDVTHGMEVIERSARTQAQLIDDLLDVSRIISGNMRLQVQPTHVRPVIDAAIASIQPAARAKALRIERDIRSPLPSVLADPVRLQQIIWNLLSNAIKFTPRNGQITIRAEQVENDLRLSVIDSGMGIEPQFLPFVFDRFRQGDASFARKFGGLGLGLGIVRHLVELHGGTVSVTSDGKDRGATFSVLLPVSLPADGEDQQAPLPRRASHNQVLSGATLLVVDDEPDARELLGRLLEGHGARIVQAESVAQAMSLLENVKVDLVISDLGMPDADGYTLIHGLRAMDREQGTTTPAIAVTAYVRQQDRERTLKEGFNMHLPKPLDPDELLRVITALLGRPVI